MKHLFDQSKILIAGCGDLGCKVAKLLTDQQQTEVWALRRQPSDTSDSKDLYPDEHPANIHWLSADLTDPASLTSVPDSITHIIYTAAADGRTEQQYRAIYLEGLKNIVAACATPSLSRIIFISSTAVYGEHGDQWVDETTPPSPLDFNGRVLVEAEHWLSSSVPQCTTISLRLSGIYGPGRRFLLDRLKQGLALAPAQGGHWVNRIHSEDAARAIVYLLTYPNPEPLYLVTDSEPMQMRTLYEALANLVNGPTPKLGHAPKSVGSKRLSNARLRATGFTFKWPDSISGHAALL